MRYERLARIDPDVGASGEFQMTLASEGEASDGDILSIKGGKIPEQMPLLSSHFNEPTHQLGSITGARKHLNTSPPTLSALGQIEMGGDGPSADIRRDLAFMIAQGHVNGVSIRWDVVPGKFTRRVNLPSDHKHFVDDTETGPARFGVFFEEWRGLEGSVVSLGADPKALIGRADDTTTPEHVAQFWRAMAEHTVSEARGLSALGVSAEELRERGYSNVDLINAVVRGFEENGALLEAYTHDGRTLMLPASLVEQLDARDVDVLIEDTGEEEPAEQQVVEVAPDADFSVEGITQPLDVSALGAYLAKRLDGYELRILNQVQGFIDARTGRVTR